MKTITGKQKHWTECHVYECPVMGTTMTARQIIEAERAQRLASVSVDEAA